MIPGRPGFSLLFDDEKVDKPKNAKIDSHTLQLRDQRKVQSQSVQDNDQSMIKVVLELDGSPDQRQISNLRERGVQIEHVRAGLVQSLVPPSRLEDLAELDFVNYVRQPDYVKQTETSQGTSFIGSTAINSAGFTGQDIKIGIIDLGFDVTNPEIASNVVEARSFRADGDIATSNPSHGTAVAEIVTDIVPDADLFLYNIETEVELLMALDYVLQQDKVDIVSMSLAAFNGPLDGSSTISMAVNDLRNSGILFVTSAGNDAERHWEGQFSDPDSQGFHEFSDEDERIAISAVENEEVEVFLSWDDWPVSNQDYDLFVFDDSDQIVAVSNTFQNPNPPREFVTFIADYTGTYNIGIMKYNATEDVEFDLFASNAFDEYNVPSGSIVIPADAEGAFTVGAVFWGTGQLEVFSSRGPTTDGRIKPDISGPDGVTTSALNPFFGTSSAAPHVAGAAALVKDVYSDANADTIQLLLEENTMNNHSKTNDDGTGAVDLIFILGGIPSASAGSDQAVNEGDAVILDASNSTDSDGTIVSYLWEQVDGPVAVSMNNTNSTVASFVAPLVAADSQLTFRVTVKDDLGASNSDTVDVFVNDTSSGPVANAGLDKIDSENDLVTLNGTATDDVPVGLTMSWLQTAGIPVVISDPSAEDPTFLAPAVDADTTLTFRFSVTDGDGLTANDTVDVRVVDFNLPPVAEDGQVSSYEDQPLNITLSATDQDSDQLSFSISTPPSSGSLIAFGESGTLFESDLDGLQERLPVSTGAIGSGSFEYDNVTRALSYNISLSGLSSSESGAFLQGPAGVGLEGGVLFPLPAGLEKAGSVNLNTLPDPPASETDLLAGLWYVNVLTTDNPSGEIRGQINPSVVFAKVQYAPDPNFHGMDSFTFEVSDGSLIDNGSIGINVESVNDPPQANAGPDQHISEGQSSSLDGTASTDDDNAITSYFWNQTLGSPIITLSNASAPAPSFTVPVLSEDSMIEFTLTVTDQENEVNTDRVTLFLAQSGSSIAGQVFLDPNKDGIASNEPGQANVTIILSGVVSRTATSNDSGLFSFEGLPPGSYSVTEVTPSGFHKTYPSNSSYSISISLLDEIIGGLSFLNAPNALPIVDAGSSQNVTANSIVTLNGTAADDFAGLTLLWSQRSGPPIVLSDVGVEDPTFAAPAVSANLTLELVATDADGATNSDAVTIHVLAGNNAPLANAGEDQTVNERSTVILDGTSSSDSDGNLVLYRWMQETGPLVTLSNVSVASPSFVAPNVGASLSLTFRLDVTDNEGAVAGDVITVEVINLRESSGGGGGGGGSLIIRPTAPTYPASYFLNNPLSRVMLLSTSFFNGFGTSVLQAAEGQQIQIESILQNQQEEPQTYEYIIQVSDENGVAVDIGIQQGIVEAADSTKIGQSWQSREPGEYRVQVFIWDGLGKSANPLTATQERTILVA